MPATGTPARPKPSATRPYTSLEALAKLKGGAVELGALAATRALTDGLKSVSNRERPDGSDDRSFPSGLSLDAGGDGTADWYFPGVLSAGAAVEGLAVSCSEVDCDDFEEERRTRRTTATRPPGYIWFTRWLFQNGFID